MEFEGIKDVVALKSPTDNNGAGVRKRAFKELKKVMHLDWGKYK